MPGTWTSVVEQGSLLQVSVTVALPSAFDWSSPQHHTLPVPTTAHVCVAPAATEGPAVTSCTMRGASVMVPIPSWPYELAPKHSMSEVSMTQVAPPTPTDDGLERLSTTTAV